MKKRVSGKPKSGKIKLNLDRVEIDKYGRTIVNEPDIAQYIKKAKAHSRKYIFLANGNYCVETNCGSCQPTPLDQCPLSGCGC